VYVSQLRKLLGRERLETQAPGYRLRVEPDELDLARFEHLRQEGKLREALALWRGPALAEFAYERFAQAEIARLEELRLVSLEERIERDLARGSDAGLVGELEALVREHPLRERLRGQLMLALYRSGRQAEALESYQAARTALVEELGIEPGRRCASSTRQSLRRIPRSKPSRRARRRARARRQRGVPSSVAKRSWKSCVRALSTRSPGADDCSSLPGSRG
jgi:DNA-binding SARP family transcriptional activator